MIDDCPGVVELLRKYGCCSWTKPGGCLEGEKHLESIGDYYNNSFEKKWPYATKRAEVSSAHLSLKVVTR